MNFLSNSLSKIVDKIKGTKYIKNTDIEEIIKDIRLSFLEADVNYEVINKFEKLIKQKTLGKKLLKEFTVQQQIIKIIKDVLIEILGSFNIPLQIKNDLNVILLVGLQGSGKTTTAGKLAFWIQTHLNKRVLLIAADIYRFGAIEQLVELGNKIGINVFFQKNEKLSKIIENGLQYAICNSFDIVIIDTAGRLTIDSEMIKEIKEIKKQIHPIETLIVSDALLGQQTANIAKSFHEQIGATGVILTKMDADIKGGAVLSIKYMTKLPIKFLSSSEKHNDDYFEIFYPERIVSRILDMGDILTLIESVEQKIKNKEDKKSLDRILQKDYNYYDLQKHLNILKKMGSMKRILNFIPGFNSKFKDMPMLEDDIIQKFEVIIQSMTKKERLNPQLIELNNRRRIRIAKGSGNNLKEIQLLISFIQKQKQVVKKLEDFDIKNLEDLKNPIELFNKLNDKK